jgi:ABC-type oligopeptide transport system ATPase subunit
MVNDLTEIKTAKPPRSTTSHTWVELSLPNTKTLARYCAWGIGRVAFSLSLFSLYGVTSALKLGIVTCQSAESGIKRLLKVYDALPYSGVPMSQVIEASATVITEPFEIITDVVSAIASKQLMIIGNSGAGKSTVAQYLAYTIGGTVRVLECEGTPDDWKGMEVIGRGEDWKSINTAMVLELEELSRRVGIRNERGDAALAGMDQVTIVEEYPEVKAKCPDADEWLERHARRGRKTLRFIICLSQYDRVSAWGLEGKSDLGDCFYRLRLGKTALGHAKSLKNDALINWLNLDKSHCLLDDQPLKLPPYHDMKAVTQRGSTTLLQPSLNNQIMDEKKHEKPLKSAQGANSEDNCSDSDRILWRLIQRLGANKTDSTVVTEILGFTGKRYSEGVTLLERLKKEFS